MTNKKLPGESGYLRQVANQASVDLQQSLDMVAAQSKKDALPVSTVKVKHDTALGYRIINEEDLTPADEMYQD